MIEICSSTSTVISGFVFLNPWQGSLLFLVTASRIERYSVRLQNYTWSNKCASCERHDVPKRNRGTRTLIVRRISMLQRSISMLQVLHINVSLCRALTLSRDAEVLAEKRSLSDERRFRSSGTRRMQRSRSPS